MNSTDYVVALLSLSGLLLICLIYGIKYDSFSQKCVSSVLTLILLFTYTCPLRPNWASYLILRHEKHNKYNISKTYINQTEDDVLEMPLSMLLIA